MLFLDELNAAAPDVQKAFYSLILDRRIGSYELPAGSVVIGAGNRATDEALARPMASALVNRLVHVHLRASAADWLVITDDRVRVRGARVPGACGAPGCRSSRRGRSPRDLIAGGACLARERPFA